MTHQDIAQLAEEHFTADAWRALSPLLTLTCGVLLLLVCEIVERLRPLRTAIFALTLLGTLLVHRQLMVTGQPGAVLGGTYIADQATAAWGMIFIASVGVAWLFARRYYTSNLAFLGEHDVLLLTTPIGMTMMAGAGDLTVFFIGLELLSIPLYCLAAFRRRRDDSVEAGLKYFVLGAFAVAMFLYGAALTYVGTGHLDLAGIGEAMGSDANPLAYTGLALMAASLFFKLSIFPFHLWVPDVYQGAPTPVTVLMATGTKAAAVAFLLRFAEVLPVEVAGVVAVLALLTMAAGNLGALVQSDLKRMLAYSGIAHAGTVLLATAGAIAKPELMADATQASLFYMAAYVFTAGGAFGILSWLEADGEVFTRVSSLRGLAQRRPWVAGALSLFLLSLGGIPATGGFLGKWLVFSVSARADLILVTVLGVLMSVIALGYYLRVIVAMYMEPAPEDLAPPMTQRSWATFATSLCAWMVIFLGVMPGWFLGRIF
jgi:NADH-quinone oxidoreductase subunit N